MLAIFALLVAFIALAAAGFIGYQYYVIDQLHRQQTEVSLASIRDELKRQQTDLEAQERDRQDAESGMRQQLQEIPAVRDAVDQLSKSVENVYTQLDRNLATWALEEVEQLVLLANHRLALNRDAEAAVVALQLADRRLLDSGDPGAISTREQIAGDIRQLQGIETVDTAGMALQLGELIRGVDTLPLKEEQVRAPGPTADAGETALESDAIDWKQYAGEIWEDVQKLVRVQNVDEPARPLLAPEQRYFLRENLKLNLASARLALLQRDQENFDLSVRTAAEWLQDYFDIADPGVQAGSKRLAELGAIKIDPELPDITASLIAVQALKKKRNAE